eukprot:2009221-Heterocapsa_arctica.AAC.1
MGYGGPDYGDSTYATGWGRNTDGLNKDKRNMKIPSSYPPSFSGAPGESWSKWKRDVAFWISGEGPSIPHEIIGPRMMTQLKGRAGLL